jgi:membrane protease YdiL (CAAX protease family)
MPENAIAVRRPPSGPSASELAIVAQTAALDVILNGPLPRSLSVPAGLAASAGVTAFALRQGASLEELGLAPRQVPRGVLYGVAAGIPLGIAAGAGALVSVSLDSYDEASIVARSPRRAAYEVLVRVPVGTALLEEILFRGAMTAIFSRRRRPVAAAAITSALFGLWHIPPALRGTFPDRGRGVRRLEEVAVWVVGSVVTTATGGLFLSWLRRKSGSTVAPWLAHAAANGAGLATGWLFFRRWSDR